MALGDIYAVKDFHRAAYATEFLNVYFYQGIGTGLAAGLADAYVSAILPLILPLQPIDITHYKIDVASLFDLSDFSTLTISEVGTVAVETSAPYTAVNFALRLPTRAIRPGSKRIGPVPETATQNGVITLASYLTSLEALRAELDDIISDPDDLLATYSPVVVKRIKFIEDGKVKYRLPTTSAEAVFANVIGATLNVLTSHQVSRERAG